MPNHKKYKSFTSIDFITDPYFQDCVMMGNLSTSLFWIDFIELHPQQKIAIEQAKLFLENIVIKEEVVEQELIDRSFEKHLIERQNRDKGNVVVLKHRFVSKNLIRIAAIIAGIVLVIAASLIVFNNSNSLALIRTAYGETKKVFLPDGSLVVLNANSHLKFDKAWSKDRNREVWLEGEAFFDVSHINQDTSKVKRYEQFLVHTNELTVEVLGTSFDIRQRRGITEVVLQEGRISVSLKSKKNGRIIMLPGDKLLYNAKEDKLVSTTTNAENFSAWKQQKLILNDPTVAEIVQYLEDNFGKKIILDNPELGQRKIEGPIILTNLEDALFVLSTVLNTEIINQGNSIIIRSR